MCICVFACCAVGKSKLYILLQCTVLTLHCYIKVWTYTRSHKLIHSHSVDLHAYQCAACSGCPCAYVQSVHTIPSGKPVSGVDIKQTQMKHVVQHNSMQTHIHIHKHTQSSSNLVAVLRYYPICRSILVYNISIYNMEKYIIVVLCRLCSNTHYTTSKWAWDWYNRRFSRVPLLAETRGTS